MGRFTNAILALICLGIVCSVAPAQGRFETRQEAMKALTGGTAPIFSAGATAGGSNVLKFAQFGNGGDDPSLTSSIVLLNLATTGGPTSGSIHFFDLMGDPIDPAAVVGTIHGPGQINGMAVDFEMPELGDLTVTTTGQGELVQGSAEVTSDGQLAGVIRFQISNVGSAAVGPSDVCSEYLSPVRLQGGVNTGMALLNPGEEEIEVNLSLLENGVEVDNGNTTRMLGPGERIAEFIDDYFPMADTDGFVGNLLMTSENGVFSALALELDAPGGTFTSLPVGCLPHPEFLYTGDLGPGFWGQLSPDWEACETDTRQSPIDIVGAVLDNGLEDLDLALEDQPIRLINNGHTIEQEMEQGTLDFEGAQYNLLQFHFHTFSEHVLGGARSPMEMHAVFRQSDNGPIAVVGVLINIGAQSDFLSNFVEHLPERSGDHFESEEVFNLLDGLTDTSEYYAYPGSLTTPPCSPIVTWIVLRNPAEMSQEQFDAFRRIMGNNFRSLQLLNGRTIRMSP